MTETNSDPAWYAPTGPLQSAPAVLFTDPSDRREVFVAALDGAELGSYDQRIIDWLCNLDDPICRTVVSLIWRVRGLPIHERAAMDADRQGDE